MRNPKTYSAAELDNAANYLRVEKSLQYFADLGLKYPLKALRQWIKDGVLIGRIRNTSRGKKPTANRYEVFVPDISRFKKDIYNRP